MHRNTRRAVGWRHLHVAIDMASRLVFSEFRPTLAGPDAVAFVHRATAYFGQQGIRVERILTYNGSAYRGHLFAAACREAGLRYTRTKVRHPWTNGRAERFIGTIQRECAYLTFRATRSALWRSRFSFPGTPPTARTTRSGVSRRRAG